MQTDADRLADAIRQLTSATAGLEGRIKLHQAATMRDMANDQAIQMARQDVMNSAEEVVAAQEHLQRLAQGMARKSLGGV